MLACRKVGASELTALAWADRATVFGVTDSPMCGNTMTKDFKTINSCNGQVVQVMFVHLLVTWQENSFLLKSTPRILRLSAYSRIENK